MKPLNTRLSPIQLLKRLTTAIQSRKFIVSCGLVILLMFSASRFSRPTQAQDLVPPIDSSFQFHHITLSVNDVDLVSQWYVDNLGFTVSDRFTLTRPDGRKIDVARIEIPGLRMNVSRFDGSVPPERKNENQGWRHIALEVSNVDQTYQQLQAKGIQFIGEPFSYDPPGYRVAFFRDLEGNILELYQDL
jgi:catechol 2,3-dioxygenase-like lactoylglutathione lyase family enzyme